MTATPRDEEDPGQEPLLPMSQEFARWVEKNDAKPAPPTGRWSPNAHTAASLSIRKALQQLPGWKRIRKRAVGRFIPTDANGQPRRRPGGKYIYISVAVAGDLDIDLLWTPPGFPRPLVIMIEVKTGGGVLSGDQRDTKQDLESGGCIVVVAGNAADAFEACLLIAKSAKARAA